MSRQNNFNLIRLLLAAAVVASHCWSLLHDNYSQEPLFVLTGHFTLGMIAVNGFFLLSGYLILASWIKTPRIFDFAIKRAKRICPAFIVASIVSVAIAAWLNGHEIRAYLFRWRVLWQAVSLSRPTDPTTGAELNVALWTIRYEVLCYAMVGTLGLLGLLKKTWGWAILWALSLGISLYGLSDRENAVAGSLVRFSTYFLTGGMFYLFRDKITYHWKYALLALAAVAVAFLNFRISSALLPLAGGYILFYIGLIDAPFLAKIRPSNDISYGLYLYGWPLQKAILWCLAISSPWAFLGASLPVAAAVGLLSWKLVEEPFLRGKKENRAATATCGNPTP